MLHLKKRQAMRPLGENIPKRQKVVDTSNSVHLPEYLKHYIEHCVQTAVAQKEQEIRLEFAQQLSGSHINEYTS